MQADNINGGTIAHIARRFFHMAMLIVPFLYYDFFAPLVTKKIAHLTLIAIIFFVFLLEKLRIRYRLVFFGQRFYEAVRISAFAWTLLSLALVLIFSPSVAYAVPIIATCAFVDPLMGELRLRKIKSPWVVAAGICAGVVVWCVCVSIYHLPFWLALLMPPIAVAAEWPQLKWIDDNAMMMLVPLGMVVAWFL